MVEQKEIDFITDTISEFYKHCLNDYEISKFLDEIVKEEAEKDFVDEDSVYLYLLRLLRANVEIPSLNKGVIDIYLERNQDLSERERNLIISLKNNTDSVFEIKEKGNDYFTFYCLTNEKTYKAYPLNKMINYRVVSKGNYVFTTLLNFEDKTYMLYISKPNNFSEYDALIAAKKDIADGAEPLYQDNEEKKQEIDAFIKQAYEKFVETFKTEVVLTTNKAAKVILNRFKEYLETKDEKLLEELQSIIEPVPEPGYFDFTKDDDEVDPNAIYDEAIIADPTEGIWIILHYGTFKEIFTRDDYKSIVGYKDCIEDFFSNRNIDKPFAAIVKIYNENPDKEKFISRLKEAFEISPEDTEFKDIYDFLDEYKTDYFKGRRYISYEMYPFVSKPLKRLQELDEIEIEKYRKERDTMEKLYEMTGEDTSIAESFGKLGRNDPCLCGSGKKYKKCCMKIFE